ncbi:Spt1 [Phodopus roborovskii]|uniref:Spt1 protein n=1 Tax=Phodopus roborovskii TaxID=109678 RepID=A0AAU9ZIH3_PHORO|nr:Spt1 [Phodopus roborovskii]
MKLLVFLVLLGVSTILVSCQDADTADTSDTETSNSESGTQDESASAEQDSESAGEAESSDEAADQSQEDEEDFSLVSRLRQYSSMGDVSARSFCAPGIHPGSTV